ncbi:MAG: PstS family phosphate ABC transporter substrate-binding protein [Cyanobacteriota bacterium]|nr:PstS family phosphate ABC transporter substrate-binding protein [Cyanobacteriota bacterium]
MTLLRSSMLPGAVLAFTLVPTLAVNATPATGPIRISGSSTVYPLMREAISSFKTRRGQKATTIQLAETGTGAGLRDLCQSKVAIANASRPINSRELKGCQAKGVTFIELPIAFDALTVVVNRGNTWANQISTSELAKLWGKPAQGRISRWSQVNRAWPNQPIKLCGPGRDSGTYDYFNKAISGDEDNSRSDYSASEQDEVVIACVAGNVNALGYMGFDRYQEARDRLRALAINAGKGAVQPSLVSVQKGTYTPLARPMFVYVNASALRGSRTLQEFVTYTVRNGLRLAEAAGAIPLPSSTYNLVESKLFNQVTGTSFGGDTPVGLSIGEALRRSFDENKRPQFR